MPVVSNTVRYTYSVDLVLGVLVTTTTTTTSIKITEGQWAELGPQAVVGFPGPMPWEAKVTKAQSVSVSLLVAPLVEAVSRCQLSA